MKMSLGRENWSIKTIQFRRVATIGALAAGLGVLGWTFVELTRSPAPRPSVVQSALPSPMASASKSRRARKAGAEPVELKAAAPVKRKKVRKPRIATKLIRGGELTRPGKSEPEVIEKFRLAVYETTVADFRSCVDAGACREPEGEREGCHWGQKGKDRFPINCVSYVDADQFCSWLDMRVPTEWEWQWAAQGREQERPYAWGATPEPDCSRAIMSGDDRDCAPDDMPVAVGSRRRGGSRDGIMDLAGNVWEWTSSSYTEGSSHKSLRGGSAQHKNHGMFRTSKRAPLILTSNTHVDGGFRCAK